MKSFLLSFSVAILVSGIISCDNNNPDDASTSQQLTSGNWRVSLFTDSGNDETSDFTGYRFTFRTDGTLAAEKSGSAQEGSWEVNSNSTRLLIDLGPKNDTNKPLGELTDDWVILSRSATEIRLTDDNAASAEFLSFTKE